MIWIDKYLLLIMSAIVLPVKTHAGVISFVCVYSMRF